MPKIPGGRMKIKIFNFYERCRLEKNYKNVVVFLRLPKIIISAVTFQEQNVPDHS